MKELSESLYKNEKAQGLVEYGLIISLVIMAVVGAVELFGIGVKDLFDDFNGKTSEAYNRR